MVLYRARLIFTLTALIPTVLITVLGIIILAEGGSKSMAVVGGILVLAFCATALAGWALGTIFVTRGASLASVQNEFLSSVSHELRTPLTSIRLFIDTLGEGRITDVAEKQRCLAIIDQELTRLDGLVGKLIDLSKIESRRDVFERRPVAVAAIVDDALAMFRTVDLATDIAVDVQMEEGLLVRRRPRGAGASRRKLIEQRLEIHALGGQAHRGDRGGRSQTRVHLGDRQRPGNRRERTGARSSKNFSGERPRGSAAGRARVSGSPSCMPSSRRTRAASR